MRFGVPLLALAALAACAEEQQQLFTAQCNDGSRVAGSKAVVESRCARFRGLKSLTPLGEGEPSVPQNGLK